MRQRDKQAPQSAEETVRDIRRATRRHFSAEEKIRIVLDGLRGEDSIAELCRKEGIRPEPLLSLVQGVPRSRQEAVGRRHRPRGVVRRGQAAPHRSPPAQGGLAEVMMLSSICPVGPDGGQSTTITSIHCVCATSKSFSFNPRRIPCM